jgi:CBS domain-containing protein
MGIPNQDPKGGDCLNILFYLTPKANCELLYDDESIREALERLELSGFSALPIVNKENGLYRGTLTEGDLLWAMKNLCNMDLKEAETHNIMEITHSRDNTPVSISTEGNELMRKVLVQNFVPVVDDRDNFIGIVTRRSILREYMKSLGIEV